MSFSFQNGFSGASLDLASITGTIGPVGADVGKIYDTQDVFTYDPGFSSTAACKSAITYIDGDKGVLLYRGIPVDQLARHSTFIEVAYLILAGELPKPAELEQFDTTIRSHTMLNESILKFLIFLFLLQSLSMTYQRLIFLLLHLIALAGSALFLIRYVHKIIRQLKLI